MKHVKKSFLLWYSPREMYDLVTAIEDYPVFLPWWERADVLQRDDAGMTARLTLAKGGVGHAFTTRNLHQPGVQVQVQLVDGRASVTVPGSKSITNRALILAALAEGETTLRGALWSEDTQVMVECHQELGFMVNVAPDPAEPCNRTLSVYGKGGRVPRGGPAGQPLDLFVGDAGTAARFLAALVCLGEGYYRLHGVGRMHERPQAALFEALRQLGYEVASPNDRLPAVIRGAGPRRAACHVSIAESSQFASALLLASRVGQ